MTAPTLTAESLGLTGTETYYGIEVRDVGEDGCLIAIGHHSPYRVLAAWNAYVREGRGYRNLYDRYGEGRGWFPDLVKQVHALWMARRPWCGECDGPDDCEDCPTGDRWWVQQVQPTAAGAFPAMWLD